MMFERLTNELFGEEDGRGRPKILSILAIYYMLNPFLYLFAISYDKTFLNFGVRGGFGVDDWCLALIYCLGAPALGYLLWTLRVRTHVALYLFLAFEVIRGFRNGIWSVVLLGIAFLIYSVRGEIRSLFRPHHGTRAVHR